MTKMHQEWTDRLSEYLDGELSPEEQTAVANHLRGCAACTEVLNDLKRVIARAQRLESRAPLADPWPAIAGRIGRVAQPRRFSFTLTQLAVAAVVLMALSGTVAVTLMRPAPVSQEAAATGPAPLPARAIVPADTTGEPFPAAASVSYADAQYDAAVADLEKALKAGRGRLDKSTVEIVEHNLQIIDQAIAQAREALAADPANSYLSTHLVEARRRKLDLLRRAAALAETD
jgi:anti-sigma factor RsiW